MRTNEYVGQNVPNVLVIINQCSFSYSIIKDSGFSNLPPYKGGESIFLRILRETHFRLNLPLKRIWYNKPSKQYDAILIFSDLITSDFIDWLHSFYPQSSFIMFFINKVTTRNTPTNFAQSYINFWSGDVDDCEKYKMSLNPDSGSYVRSWKITKKVPRYDIFFVGKDKGKKRLSELLSLEKKFNGLGLRTYFHIVAEHRYDKYANIHYKGFMPYSEVLTYLECSRAILYLGYGSQRCVTIRIQESLVHKIKMVTDCAWIKGFDFYHPNNFFIIGEDNMDDLPAFLDRPYVEMKSPILDSIFFDDSVAKMVSMITPPSL